MIQDNFITAGSLFVLAIMILAIVRLKKTLSKIKKEIIIKNKLIEEYKEAVETANAKTCFFIDMAHELKTPLNVIISALQLIEHKNYLEENDREKVKNLLKIIKSNSYSLMRLVNNVLDVARSESMCLEFNPVNCNIVAIIQNIVNSTAPFAEQKDININFYSESEEMYADIDIEKFEKIVLNLLSNAIKYIERNGKINISISDNNEYVRLSVKDNGPGIPENMHSAIFEKFRQFRRNMINEYEGSGIGLFIVKSFVQLHNGNVWVVSKENAGAEFIVELPKKQCACRADKANTVGSFIHDEEHIARLTAIELSNSRLS